jgi:hypothetical protein
LDLERIPYAISYIDGSKLIGEKDGGKVVAFKLPNCTVFSLISRKSSFEEGLAATERLVALIRDTDDALLV